MQHHGQAKLIYEVVFWGGREIAYKSDQGNFLTTFGGDNGMFYLVMEDMRVYMIVKTH